MEGMGWSLRCVKLGKHGTAVFEQPKWATSCCVDNCTYCAFRAENRNLQVRRYGIWGMVVDWSLGV